mgnify:CR=1 FL=1
MKVMETNVRVFKYDGEFNFCITQDHLDGIKATEKEVAQCKRNGMDQFFKLYDDDDELYYSGYYNEDAVEDEFEVLDWAMNDSGCTRMDIRGKSGKMETL